MPQKLIGLTGPSAFTPECIETIEELLGYNFVQLTHGLDNNLTYWLDQVDGVIVAGGIDIHPTVYSESIWNNHNLTKFDLKRDYRELAIITHCMQKRKPLLGICRGHQLIGVKFGMGFIMDLSSSTICHQPQRSQITLSRDEPAHYVKFVDDGVKEMFYETYKMPRVPPERAALKGIMHERSDSKLFVNSFHHQGIAFNSNRSYKDDGIDVIALGRIDLQHCKSIVEFMQGDRWLSVQWHPEFDWKDNTPSRVVLERFKTLVEGGE